MHLDKLIDRLAIQDLTTRYARCLSRGDFAEARELFTDDGIYRAFGQDYSRDDLPRLMAAAPRGQLIVNPPEVEIDNDTASGSQHYIFITQDSHDMRLAWYTDEYRRVDGSWRFAVRSTTFLRRSGTMDSGRAHDPLSDG